MTNTDIDAGPDAALIARLPEGWYEFVTSVTATTEIAYVQENGDIYTPDSTPLDWEHAVRREHLVRESDIADCITELQQALAERDATIAAVISTLDTYDQSDEDEEWRETAPEDNWRLYRDLDAILSAAAGDALRAHDAEVQARALEDAADEYGDGDGIGDPGYFLRTSATEIRKQRGNA